MFSEDYLLRIIRQATAVLARIIGFKNSGQYQEATKEIDQTLQILFGMDPEFVRLLDDESIYLFLKKNDTLDFEKLEFIADLFKEEGDIQELQNHNSESKNCYLRSLNYYLMIRLDPEFTHPIELTRKINELLQNLDCMEFSEGTLWNLYCFYENEEEFAKAESMLMKLASQHGSTINLIDEMKSFYTRLLKTDPKNLNTCGISLTHIHNKLEELE